ncbi:MAG TPA: V-type ATP synthase subunit I, partial [Clostridia bacterium]
SLSDEIDTLEAASVSLAARRADFEILHDYYLMETDRLRSATRLRHTRSAFILSGWVPASMGAEIARGLGERFTVAVELREPNPDEDIPILMENIPLIRPYEVITEMYSTPLPTEIDPNPLMAPFFCILFGLMLNDAGYGLLLVIGCAVMVWGLKVQGNVRRMCLLFIQGGVAGIVSGLLFGSFFGDIVSVVSGQRAAFPTLWFNPLQDPVRMMILSMVLGVIHVFTGMGAKAYMLIRRKRVLDALLDVGSWYMTLIGLGMLAVGGVVGSIGTVMAITGALTIILFSARDSRKFAIRVFKGLYNLYGITGYMSDVLSYTRILALGLAGGVIAMVVNMIGSIAGFGLVGFPLFVVVALGGHVLNLALSVLGAYVHTSRLHYVEFFSKFFEGGGRPWAPLRTRTRYIEIK